MVSAIGGTGALQILSGSQGTSVFAGAGSGAGSGASVLQGMGGGDAASNIRATLDRAASMGERRQILSSALQRLRGVAQGVIQPSAEWETTGGYLQDTGQPFKIGIDDRGQPKVTPQVAGELQDYTPRQRRQIEDANARLETLVEQADLENQKGEFRSKLAFAILRVEEMKKFSPAEEAWEMKFERLKERGVPVKVGLDSEGEVIALNQLQHDFADVENESDRLRLQQARRDLENILNGDKVATELWQFEAQGNASSGDDYFLGLDEDGQIDVKRNNLESVTPEFLEADEDGPDTQADWEEKALELYADQKSFHFDFGPDGELEVVENNYTNVVQRFGTDTAETDIRNALVSLIA